MAKNTIPKTKLKELKTEIERAENALIKVKQSLGEVLTPEMSQETKGEQIVEGVFDGEFMVKGKTRLGEGSSRSQKKFPIPPNYASKSKLVEGDKLKLKIEEDGTFTYKQIEPVERKNLIGTLEQDGEGYKVKVKDETYKVITASITYFGAKNGDKISIVVPEGKKSKWAAVEGVV